ncbi:Sodium channel protein type 4 subunit alpha B Voltage-gated sodium channel subunit alpha Nav1.4b [Larimichthys crocea]|uniref:Sodium channel protein type 4 subunit alpha B Voltage-gated sodium channel subunit alpha Nav1.4b n=1 Tax=Larimichthys crocea TaxID=215358 RepID=A0A6G0IX93_LARCR|nr:Sodium channel protein type 4 subunit alpha B Voltage-gated sodium channel subunit alpha Nav1.4b [Larimichthys crocea]
MSCRKKSFWEFWRSKTERRVILQRANQLKLLPSQLKQLLGDRVVRTELQNTRTASLLPPVGTEVFRCFVHEAQEEEQDTRKKDKESTEMDRHKLASDLEAGKPLPFIYGDPPPELLYTPLEELDPYYQSQKTFIVLSKWNIIHRFNAESSCYLLSPFNPLRTVAIKILIHYFFRMFILLTILTNCAFMIMSDPPTWTKNVECVFVAIYTFDIIIKIMSRGFCVGKFTFLRDPWNWLDIMIISTAFLAQFVHFGKFSVLMMIPRVLKIITVIRGLKTTVGALIQSVKRLAGVFVLMAFCLSVFALIGLQLFMGSLKNNCFLSPRNLTNSASFISDYYDNTTGSDRNFTDHPYYLPGRDDALLCGNTSDAGVCPEGYVCMKMGKNPNYGYTNYDSIGWSLLALFRVMTGDWEDLALMTLRAHGKRSLTFFVLVVFPGFFCVLSLILVVVAMAISDQKEAVVAEARQKEEEFNQIVESLKRREEEERAACRVALSEKQDGENEKSHEQTNTAAEDHRLCSPCCYIFANHVLKWNCCGCWRCLKHRLYSFVMNPFFDLGIITCLIINTIFMAMEHFPLTAEFESHLSSAALVFTAIFVAEMVLKLVAMDPYGYFQVSWHIFDFILVAISLLNLSLESNFLRFLLVMRVLRLARWWPSFHLLLKVMWTPAVINLILLLLIVVFIFTIAGMHLFQKDYKENVCHIMKDCQLPRWNMTNFFNAFLIIFRVLCGEWIDDLLGCMEVSGQNMCLIFFVMVVFIGNLLVLNLFLNLLLSAFISDSLVAPNQVEKNNMHIAISWTKTWILEHLLGKKNHVKPDHTVGSMEDHRKDYLTLDFVTSDQTMLEVKALSGNHDNRSSNYHNTESRGNPITTAEIKMEEEKKCDIVQTCGDDDHKGNTPEDCCCDQCYRCCPILDSSRDSGRFWSNFRRVCFTIIHHNYFEIFIIIIILLSSIVLVFEDIHLQHLHVLKGVVETANQVFTYLFLLEMLLKWFGLGLKKYFTSAWCWLDFIILDVFLVSLMADMLGFSGLRVFQFLRTLRALAPLRALSRFEGLRVVVQVLVQTIPAMFDGLLVFLVVWLMFSVVGVNLFAGKFFFCYNKTSEKPFQYDIVNNRSQCLTMMEENYTEVSWENAKSNYDNVGNGYLSLLQLTVSVDWDNILYSAVDYTGVENQPSYQSNPNMNLFFISFFIISSFFTFNFFIRVIISDLQRHKRGKHPFMTEAQQKYSWSLRKLFSKKPNEGVPRPQNKFQAWLFDLVTSWCFEVFMVVVICLNMVILMVETEEQSEQKEEILFWFHFVIIVIFLIEFILKIITLRKFYFSDCYNIIDFLVIFVSIIGLFIEDLLYYYFVSLAVFSVFRLVRIGRVLHLIHCARGIRKLFLSFMMSLPALFNISLLLFLILFTFSLFGMFNFAYVKKEHMIDDMFNFETFGNSMICLLMISISAGFHSPIMNTPPDCDLDIENPGLAVRGNCGNPLVGIIFFTTFIVLSYLLVIHLYIAVILQTFNSEDTVELCDNEVQMFCKTWSKFDPDASQFIQYSKLSDFCDALQDPLRIPKPNTIKLINMDLPLFPEDKIHCADVLLALATQGLNDSRDICDLKAKMEERFKANLSKVPCKPISSTLQRKQKEVAATVIQRAYRKGRDTTEMAVQSVDGHGGVSDVSGSSKPDGASE